MMPIKIFLIWVNIGILQITYNILSVIIWMPIDMEAKVKWLFLNDRENKNYRILSTTIIYII